MKKELANFEVDFIQILKEDGTVDKKSMPDLTSSQIKQMYEAMILSKVFDEKAQKGIYLSKTLVLPYLLSST